MTAPPTKRDERDELDRELERRLGRVLRKITLGRPLPRPTAEDLSDDELLLLVDDLLPASERAALLERLAAAPYSSHRLEILRAALAEFEQRARLDPEQAKAAAPSRVARVVLAIRRGVRQDIGRGVERTLEFVRGTMAPLSPEPIAVATRSSAPPAAHQHYLKFVHPFGDWDAVIELESVPTGGIDLQLHVSHDGVTPPRARAALKRDGKLVESVRVRDGLATFNGLAPASYVVELSDQDVEIGQVDLKLLEA